MPFTFSHPAIILPLTKLKTESISASALVVGSMAPDFEYFFKMKLSGRFSHTLPGVFIFDLPVALLVLLLFHLLVKKPLINSLPTVFYSRLAVLRDFNWMASFKKHPIAYTGCILAGIFSHLLWDSITHANYFITEQGVLSYKVQLPGFPVWPVFRYLQYISTIIGGFYVVFYFYRLPSENIQNTTNLKFLLLVLLIAALIFLARAHYGFEYLGDKVATAIGSAFLSLVLVSALFRFICTQKA